MDFYLQILYKGIITGIAEKIESYDSDGDDEDKYPRCPAGLHKIVQEVEDLSDVTLNFNENGRLHSKYLGDRYEPAIIIQYSQFTIYYYLFDGEIKDCVHPFSIDICAAERHITYYSSERIKQELPIYIMEDETAVAEIYNGYNPEPLIAGYKHGRAAIDIANYPAQDYFLHDLMEPPTLFKFAD